MPSSSATAAARPRAAASSTRERILEIARELFTEHGYEQTSVRDIAARLGTTGAALYYHFPSKADILIELHARLYAAGRGLLAEMAEMPDGAARVAAWPRLVDRFITSIDEQRALVQMYRRNQHAIELVHAERDQVPDDDTQHRLQTLFAGPDVTSADRMRVACSIGAVMEGLLSDVLVGDIPHAERVALVRASVADLLR